MSIFAKYSQVLVPIVLCLTLSFILPLSFISYQIVIFSFVLGVTVFFLDEEQNFALVLGLIPIEFILARDTGQSVFTWVVILVLLKNLLFFNSTVFKKQSLVAYVLFLLWELSHIGYYPVYEEGWIQLFRLSMKLFIIIFYVCYIVNNININQSFEYILLIFGSTLLLSGLYGIFYFITEGSFEHSTLILDQESRVGGFGFNVNRFAGLVMIVLSSIPLALQRNKLNSVLLIVCFFAFSILGFLSGSRSYLISFVLLVVSMSFLMPKKKNNLKARLLGLTVMTILFLYVIFNYDLIDSYIESMRDRALFEKQEGGSRFEIFKHYFFEYISSPMLFIFGFGIYSYFYTMGYDLAPHNLVIEPFLAWGIVGVFILSFFISQLFLIARVLSGGKSITFLTLLPIVFFLIQSGFSSLWTEQYFYIVLSYCILTVFISSRTEGSVSEILS